jgi:predicted AlkP superfamily phosphohydrolase/phosphomutase
MREGELPAMQDLATRSARYLLDHGPDLRTGLAGEHIATGLSAKDAHRWAAVHFDPSTYEVWQQETRLPPFPSRYSFRTVVFDPPYFDLVSAANVRGVVNWGAHDPGVPPSARPQNLLDEVIHRFGSYPASRWIYGTPWNSIARAKAMGEALAASVRLRTEIAAWMFKERLADWDLALLTVSEPHSAIEGLWHGVDDQHPLHRAPSASVARTGIVDVYKAIDALVARMRLEFPDATIVLFSMHGMGANGSDVASMFLLGELLYRHAFHHPRHTVSDQQQWVSEGIPDLQESESWKAHVDAGFHKSPDGHAWQIARKLARRLPQGLRGFLRRRRPSTSKSHRDGKHPLEWMPVTSYRRFWARMPAFALPSFYDGRVRLNVTGRESRGTVPVRNYGRVRGEIARLISDCKNPLTGRSVVKSIHCSHRHDPLKIADSESDIVIVWDGAPLGLVHPTLGMIGPVPYRRPGGHTGKHGFAHFSGDCVAPGEWGLTSSYDVVPTILALLGVEANRLSGSSLLGQIHRHAQVS